MKLKQALVIGLSSAILALPAIAAESANPSKDAKTIQPMTMEMPASKEAFHHKKGHKKVSFERKTDPKQNKENAKLDELNTLNSHAAKKDPTEKNTVKA